MSPELVIDAPPVGEHCSDGWYNASTAGQFDFTGFRLPSRELLRLRGVEAVFPDSVVEYGGSLIEESLPAKSVTYAPRFIVSNILPHARRRLDRAFMLALPEQKNYHLWLHYAFPRLMAWETLKDRSEIEVLLPESCPRHVVSTLDRATEVFPDLRLRFLRRGRYRTSELLLVPPLGHRDVPNPRAVEWLRTKFGGVPTRNDRLLYISRAGAAQRQLLDEDAFMAELTHLGFELIQPGELSFAQQVEVFSQARVILGPHGAAFANAAFAPRGATLIELLGGSHFYPCFRFLAGTVGIRYAAVPIDSHGPHVKVGARLPELLSHVRGYL